MPGHGAAVQKKRRRIFRAFLFWIRPTIGAKPTLFSRLLVCDLFPRTSGFSFLSVHGSTTHCHSLGAPGLCPGCMGIWRRPEMSLLNFQERKALEYRGEEGAPSKARSTFSKVRPLRCHQSCEPSGWGHRDRAQVLFCRGSSGLQLFYPGPASALLGDLSQPVTEVPGRAWTITTACRPLPQTILMALHIGQVFVL